MKRIISLVAIICFLLTFVLGCTTQLQEQKDPYYISDEEYQAEWEVLERTILSKADCSIPGDMLWVILTHEATETLKDYTAEDFAEVKPWYIEDDDSTGYSYYKNKTLGLPVEQERNIDLTSYRRMYAIYFEEQSTENAVRAKILLERRADVDEVELNLVFYNVIQTDDVFNTTEREENMRATHPDWWVNAIKLEDAWEFTEGDEEVMVGVLDSGIDPSHPAITSSIYSGTVLLHCDFTTGVGNGTPLATPTDDSGHGTIVAGVIAGQAYSDYVKGIAPNIKLVSIKVLTANGTVNRLRLKRAIEYAETIHLKIINMSLGFETLSTPLKTAIGNFNGLAVCSAGNDNKNINYTGASTDTPNFPASFDLDNIVSVGNHNSNYWKFGESNYGNEEVDLFAPGTNIDVIVPSSANEFYSTDRHLVLSGTSIAAPMVTGVAALLLSYYPSITTEQLKAHILETAEYTILLATTCKKEARLNAYNAIHIDATPTETYTVQNHIFTYTNCPACNGTHVVTEPHTITCTYNSTGHIRTCAKCNYIDDNAHTIIYRNLGEYAGHSKTCYCGYATQEYHTWIYSPIFMKNVCIYCNAKSNTGPSPQSQDGELQ